MENKRRKKKIIIEGFVSFILLALLMTINELTEITFDVGWFRNIDVWFNDFFVNTFVFFLMSTLLSKIKNEYLNFGISYVISVLIGNFIQLDSSNLNVTPRLIILIVLNILMLIVWGWSGYNRGKRKAQKEIRASEQEYVQTVLQMDNRARSELYNLSRFIKKHPKECATIDKFGIDFVMTFIEDDKTIRKAMKEQQKSKNQCT
jgi:uncharacterized membrane protein